VKNPHDVTREFEKEICNYTGSPFAVAVNSCTMAVFLSLKWFHDQLPTIHRVNDRHLKPEYQVVMPKYTYNSIPMVAQQAGFKVGFSDLNWIGEYLIDGTNIWDSARRFTSGMYRNGQVQCLSFHSSKILGDSQGGAIIHDNPEFDAWARRARFDGRTEGMPPAQDKFINGYHCYLSPDVSSRLLWKLSTLPKHNVDLPNSEYADLSLQECFK
jgi:dTDP-4-amino-4,6-dideoxygalactose transaminase